MALDVDVILILLSSNFSSFKWKLIFYMFIFMGLRRSELMALRWKDINFITSEAVIRGRVITAKNRAHFRWGLKNGDHYRVIVLPNVLLTLIKQYRLLNEINENKERYIFESKNHQIWDPNNFARRFKKELVYLGNDRRFTIHELRHSHATLLMNLGIDLKTVADRLGHKDIRTLTQYYLHSTESARHNVVKVLDDFIDLNVDATDK